MDFTREPIIESVITPKEGYKIVVRSSKNSGQEEFFVDAVEVVAFGNCLFFRSMERPKEFLVPVSDYEILEVREARMVLKNVGVDKAIKIAGGKEAKPVKEPMAEKKREEPLPAESEPAQEKKKDRKRNYRRRRGKEETALSADEENTSSERAGEFSEESELVQPQARTAPVFTSLLAPPDRLISETLARYREEELKEVLVPSEELEPVVEAILEKAAETLEEQREPPYISEGVLYAKNEPITLEREDE